MNKTRSENKENKNRYNSVYLLAVFFSLFFLLSACTNTNTGVPQKNTALQNNEYISDDADLIKIPISDVTNTIKKYSYDSNGVNIRYFTVLGSDGNIRTAFDACDVCGGQKGYFQQGTDVVCANCGKVFKIDSLGTVNTGGGCWPAHLTHTLDGDNIVINKAELESKRGMFV